MASSITSTASLWEVVSGLWRRRAQGLARRGSPRLSWRDALLRVLPGGVVSGQWEVHRFAEHEHEKEKR
ncbi:MAG TPA: hypothetical protein VMN36_11575 [Verrucomicrobiales bacterium]|nr:hypothetical protein [Verrucomicrobiales bacterium]